MVEFITALACVGWVIAALFVGVMAGEHRARQRFDATLEAKFGESAAAEADDDEDEDLTPEEVEKIAALFTFGGDDEEDESGEPKEESIDNFSISSDAFDLDSLPTSETAGGVKLVWFVPGEPPWGRRLS
jgi:hypothetical protein